MYITSTKNVEREKVRELDKRKKRSLKCCLFIQNFKLDPHKPEWSELISLKCCVIMIVYALNNLASHANT